MSVNNNFYATINEAVTRASAGTISDVIDYASFIDAGKKLADLENTDVMNGFASNIINKIQKTIIDNPSYRGALIDMYKGSMDYGVLEIIMSDFYDASASVFDGTGTLVDGETYTDQFKVNLPPEGAVRYYTEYDSYGIDVTIRDTDLKGAWASPERMDAWIRVQMANIGNSHEFHKELARLNTVAGIINDIIAANESEDADENNAAIQYSMLSIYNEEFGTSVTASNWIGNDDFISWTTGVIRDVKKLLEKPSKLFSIAKEVTTFTTPEQCKLVLNSVYDKAIRRSLIGAFNKEYGMIDFDYEVVPYWQNISDRMKITTNTEAESETAKSADIIAMMYDKRAVGEMVNFEGAETTRNGRRRYTNYHFQYSNMYFKNPNANTVIFTLD